MQHLRPDQYCPSLREVDFALLSRLGRVNLCLDLDNTVAPRDAMEPAEGVAEALQRALGEGLVRDFCLVSNVIWGRRRAERVEHFARLLGTPHFYAANFWNRKPRARPFLEAMRMMGSTPATTAVVGDQIFTDVAGGRRLGLYTVLVQPLGPDHWTTRLTSRRRREADLLKRFGLAPEPKTAKERQP